MNPADWKSRLTQKTGSSCWTEPAPRFKSSAKFNSFEPLALIMKKAAFLIASIWVYGLTGFADDSTHEEVKSLRFEIGLHGKITTMAMAKDGNLLVGVSWVPEDAKPVEAKPKSDQDGDKNKQRHQRRRFRDGGPPSAIRGKGKGSERAIHDPFAGQHFYAIKVISPTGKILRTWPMKNGLVPKMIHGCADGTIYVAGGGKLAELHKEGQVLKQISTDEVYGQKVIASGLYANGKYVFIAFGTGFSLRATEDFYRFDRDLSNPKKIIEQLYGCCAHIDLEVKDEEILVAENSRHRVKVFDFDGNFKRQWGRRDRVNIEGFTACCNPVNMDIGPKGVFYTAESGVGRVKKYSSKGKYLGLVGYVDTTKFDKGSRLAAQSCYIPIEVNEDASRIYIMDVRNHIIRVLAKKSYAKK